MVILFLVGALIGYFVVNILLGIIVYISGKLMGHVLRECTIFGVRITKIKGKLSASASTFSPTVSVTMVRKDDDPVPEDPVSCEFKSSCSLIVLALIINGAVAAAGVLLAAKYTEAKPLVNGFLIMLGLWTLIIISTCIDTIIKLKGNSEKAVAFRESIIVRNKWMQGVRPRDIEVLYNEDKVYSPQANIYLFYVQNLYYHLLDKGDFYYIERLLPYFQKKTEYFAPANVIYYFELLYYYSIMSAMGNKECNFKAYELYSRCQQSLENDNDVNARRVLSAFKLYVANEPESALELATEGLKNADDFNCSGLVAMEKELLENIIKSAQFELARTRGENI